MLNTAAKSEAPGTEQELTDGFHLVIDALKLNGINTIYNVPGIPITDLGRMAQAAGIRVLSFRHEQNAGYAASIAGLFNWSPRFREGCQIVCTVTGHGLKDPDSIKSKIGNLEPVPAKIDNVRRAIGF